MWRQPAPQQGWGPSRPSAGLCPLSLGAGEAGAALPSLLLGPEPWTVSSAPRDPTRHRGIIQPHPSSAPRRGRREEIGVILKQGHLSPRGASDTPAVKLEEVLALPLLSPVFCVICHHPLGITCCCLCKPRLPRGKTGRTHGDTCRGRCVEGTSPHR